MKILVIAATPFFSDRGCHLRIANEALGLKKLGHSIRICTYHHGKNLSALDIQRISPSNWYQKTSPGFAWGKFWLDWKLLLLVRKQLRIFSPDLLHCHLYEGLALGFLAQLFSKKKLPLVGDLQGDLTDEFKKYHPQKKFLPQILFPFANFFLKKATALIISSQRGQIFLKKKYPALKKISVIQDGINLNFFSAGKLPLNLLTQKELEKIKTWKKDARLLIYAGGLSSAKGITELFLFFGKNFAKNDGWKLLIFGNGEEKAFLQKTLSEENWSEKIYLAEQSNYDQLPAYLQLADLAIDPKTATSESSGKLPIYMASGLPIICFDNSFNRDKLKEQGYYFQDWLSFQKILLHFQPRQPSYDLTDLDNQKEIKKLESLMKKTLH